MGTGTGQIWRKPITLAAQFERTHVEPSDIKLMAAEAKGRVCRANQQQS